MANVMYRPKLFVFIFSIVLIVLTLSSCANRLIAVQMVSAPNDSLLGTTVNNQFEEINTATDRLISDHGFTREYVQFGDDGITMSYFDIAPGEYGFNYLTTPHRNDEGKVRWIKVHWQWSDSSCAAKSNNNEARGTMMFLHGWARDNRSLIRYAIAFAQLGYRVIVPDLRGHGESTGDWLSFGQQESHDIKLLADHLNLERFDLFGFSLGASAGIHLASMDDRISSVVAIAPMHDIEQTIPKFGARSRPWIARLLENEEKSIVAAASSISGFDYPRTSNTMQAATQLNTPILLIYGEIDQMSDEALNRKIYKQVKGPKQLHEMKELRHTHVLQHQTELMRAATSWLGIEEPAQSLAPSNCEVNEFKQGYF